MRNRNSSSNGVEQNRRDVPWRLCSHASARRLFLTILFNAVFASCKNGTPVTATQVVLDSADQVLLGMSHYVTELGVLRARVELRNVHVTFYDIAGNPTSTLTSREGTDHWRTDDMEARGNVVVVRDKDGGTMRTEVMTYNRVRNEGSSDKSFVWDEPGRHVVGDGFTSDPEFKKITAKRPHGTGGQFLLPNQ